MKNTFFNLYLVSFIAVFFIASNVTLNAQTASIIKIGHVVIKNDGTVTYSITKDGEVSPPKTVKIENAQRIKLVAMIKETGFLALPFESFSIKEGTETYQKYGLKITLNDDTNQLYWPEADATEKMIPPIITMVQEELESIMEIIRE